MVQRFSKTICLLGFNLLLFSTVVYSHEYWLDTADSIVNIKNQVIVDIRNGQNYSGTAFPYDSAKYKSIQINSIQAPVDYKGRLGDYPAITYTPTTQGLHSISLESKESYLVYEPRHSLWLTVTTQETR